MIGGGKGFKQLGMTIPLPKACDRKLVLFLKAKSLLGISGCKLLISFIEVFFLTGKTCLIVIHLPLACLMIGGGEGSLYVLIKSPLEISCRHPLASIYLLVASLTVGGGEGFKQLGLTTFGRLILIFLTLPLKVHDRKLVPFLQLTPIHLLHQVIKKQQVRLVQGKPMRLGWMIIFLA